MRRRPFSRYGPISVGKPWPHSDIALPSAHTPTLLLAAFVHVTMSPPRFWRPASNSCLSTRRILFASILLTMSESPWILVSRSFKVTVARCSLRFLPREGVVSLYHPGRRAPLRYQCLCNLLLRRHSIHLQRLQPDISKYQPASQLAVGRFSYP